MFFEAITRGRALQVDFDEFYIPRLDDPELAGWLDYFDQLKNYNRKEYLNETKWRRAREEALKRDGGVCIYPHSDHSKRLQVHHMQPLRYGGDPYARWNLATVCQGIHVHLHPGMEEAYRKFRNGNKKAFLEYAIYESTLPKYIPPKEALILRGVVIEKERSFRIKLNEYQRDQRGSQIRHNTQSK